MYRSNVRDFSKVVSIFKENKIIWTLRFTIQLEDNKNLQTWITIELLHKLNTLKVKEKEINKVEDLFNKLQKHALILNL